MELGPINHHPQISFVSSCGCKVRRRRGSPKRRRRKIWIVCCGCLGALCQNIDHFWRSAHSFLLFFIFLLYLTHGVFLTTSFYWFQIIFVIFPFLASILFLKCISICGAYGKTPYLLLQCVGTILQIDWQIWKMWNNISFLVFSSLFYIWNSDTWCDVVSPSTRNSVWGI